MPPEAAAYLDLADIRREKWPMVQVAADLMRRAKPLAASNRAGVLPGATTAGAIIDELVGGWFQVSYLLRTAAAWRRRRQPARSAGCPACRGAGQITNPKTHRPLICEACRIPHWEAMEVAGDRLPRVRAAYLAKQRRWCQVAYAVAAVARAAEQPEERRVA